MSDQIFNERELLIRVQGDLELIRLLTAVFKEEYPRILDEIQIALTARDLEALEVAAHRMKGCVGNFSAAESSASAKRLESLAQAGDLQFADQAFEDLKHKIADLVSRLDQREVSQ